MFTRRLALILTPALAATGLLATAAPAHADLTPAITCTGWTYTTYTPGLTDTVHSTTVVDDGDLDIIDAHSPTGSCLPVGSAATAGSRDVTALLELSCTQLITETGTETVDWNDGQSTSFPFTATVVRGLSNTVITETGTVTAGEFSGDHVVETFTALNTAFAACVTPGGVTSLDFADIITITPL
ncbi:hypothetical protein [Kitasatospora kifunensis]|uniref:Uncharacterized protein n=1 Tax=Kitasatospora kifunensis TaxID=58351 RepID=A0A7W7R0H8_KITKI|nr:hypothetical protein [Kitasatospora kifunensis]MBB4922541.1 hypothetical protein [Kitasatospora kifunensis]